MYNPKMLLNQREKDILNGKEGRTRAKMMEVLARYGDMFDAE